MAFQRLAERYPSLISLTVLRHLMDRTLVKDFVQRVLGMLARKATPLYSTCRRKRCNHRPSITRDPRELR